MLLDQRKDQPRKTTKKKKKKNLAILLNFSRSLVAAKRYDAENDWLIKKRPIGFYAIKMLRDLWLDLAQAGGTRVVSL